MGGVNSYSGCESWAHDMPDLAQQQVRRALGGVISYSGCESSAHDMSDLQQHVRGLLGGLAGKAESPTFIREEGGLFSHRITTRMNCT